jgi:arylsulfatase A-like enzyme
MADQPNILFVFTDQHRLSAVGAYGETPCRTPHIDRLAAEGVLFENAYTVYPVCSPARGSVMTGHYPHTHGITSNLHEVGCSVHELEDRPTLLPRKLQAAGYSTGYTGKWHLGTERARTFGGSNRPSLPSTIGFEGQDFPGHGGSGEGYGLYRDWLADQGLESHRKPWAHQEVNIRGACGEIDLPSSATIPGYLATKSIDLIDDFRSRGRPWFHSLNFWGPHSPYHASPEFVDMYRDASIPPWPNFDWPARETPGPHHMKIFWDHEKMTWDDYAAALRYYYARASLIDSQMGRVIEHLRKTGDLANTWIIFTADHGETLGSHGGLMDKGWHHFEETHHIPFIVRPPDGVRAGERMSEFVSLVDVFPTVLDLAGADCSDAGPHGCSLVPLVRGTELATPWRDSVVVEFLGLGNVATCMKTIRCGDWKYGANLAGGGDELYNLAEDPHETSNRFGDPSCAGKVAELRQKLLDWMVETGDPARRMYTWWLGQAPDK